MIELFGEWSFATSPVVALLELVIMYLFFSRLAKPRIPEWELLLLGLTVLVVQPTLVAELSHMGLSVWKASGVGTFFVLCFAMGWLAFRISPWKVVGYAGVLAVLRVMAAVIAREFVFKQHGDFFEALDMTQAALSCLLFELGALVIANLVAGDKGRPKLPVPVYLCPAAVLAGVIWLAKGIAQEPVTMSGRTMMLMVSMALCVATVVVVLVYQLGWERKRIALAQRQKEEQLQMEQSYYEILERQNQQLRSYAHDAKNHLEAIRNLNQDPKVEQYIAQMEQQLQAYTRRCHSGNRALDVMVDKYVTACELKNIAFTYDVQLCNLGGVEDFDLVAILGNLLDNALTAAQDSQGKWVELATALRNGYQVVVVENSCDRPPIVGEEGLRSTKAGGENHGFGLKSVAKALKKYEGDFQWDYDQEKRRFTMTVMIGQRVSVRESRRMAQDAKC